MKTLKDYLREDKSLPETKKYISIIYDDETQQKLRNYCIKNGFDLTTKYNGEKQNPEDFKFHTTIFYSTTNHQIKNEISKHKPSEVYAKSFDLFGENKDVPVLKVESDALSELRSHFENEYNMEDEWPDFNPHVSLSYNRDNLPNMNGISLPDFTLVFDKLKIEDLDDS